jgi:hypothetical protein
VRAAEAAATHQQGMHLESLPVRSLPVTPCPDLKQCTDGRTYNDTTGSRPGNERPQADLDADLILLCQQLTNLSSSAAELVVCSCCC